MKFDVYFPFTNKAGVRCPGVQPHPKTWAEVKALCAQASQVDAINKVRSLEGDGRAEAKKQLPAVCYMGKCQGTRSVQNTRPTGLVMIDIDHVASPTNSWLMLEDEMEQEWKDKYLLLVHITPSGNGLRLVFKAPREYTRLEACITEFGNQFNLERFGNLDTACKDFSRLSFLPKADDILYENDDLLNGNDIPEEEIMLENNYEHSSVKEGQLFPKEASVGQFTDAEISDFENYDYRGVPVKIIIEKWVKVHGEPGRGEIHNYYNEMVKNFRNIVSNNKRALLYLLPRFGHSAEECWSSIISICRFNSLSKLPAPFYFFLKDNGFYKEKVSVGGSLAEYMMEEKEDEADPLPWLPPVFREFIKVTPKDFRVSMVNALMPVMGTLASYLQAPYYYDGRMHTPSFFSIIYAPAGTGKGFVERICDCLFERLKIRDYIQQARENIYLTSLLRKGANDKAPADPHTMLGIIPPKNSEAEFLQKMKDNCGYHMFTYAAEMDSWAKGVKAAGGNKDDMIRIAWDNGEYGQQFRSANTFKGCVKLYWNVLITGTIQQLMSYFMNVENGLITRCSFTTIDNQEFAEAPLWKSFSQKDKDVVKRFIERCDSNTYEQPCNLLPEDVDCIEAENFDKEVNWRFTYKERQEVNMDWLRPTIDDFLNEQRTKAATDFDKARDVFRRRVAVRGFRLGLLCYALWEKPRIADLRRCIPFIKWWMEKDVESSLKLWGNRYNNEAEDAPTLPQRSLFNELPNVFSKVDIYTQCLRQGIKTPIRNIIYRWQKMGHIKKTRKDEYEKVKVKKT